MQRSLPLLFCCLTPGLVPPNEIPGNVLVVVIDDTGVDRIGAYDEHPDPGRTDNIDRLAQEGVLFRNFYVNMVCSPSRAAAMTGRFGFRTGVGTTFWASSTTAPGFPDDSEWTLPEVLPTEVRTMAIGKWHLASASQGIGHPLAFGFDTFAGCMFNPGNYQDWPEILDGHVVQNFEYTTTAFTDRALRALQETPSPWFLWLAYNAAHKPLHVPPDHLHSFDLSGSPRDSAPDHHKAAVEAFDTEFGRLLEAVDLETTTVIFLSDNGTLSSAVTPPFTSGKPEAFEGGTNAPLIIAGRAVREPGRECTALVTVTDLFGTVVELMDGDLSTYPSSVGRDSISLVPYLQDPDSPALRSYAFSEFFQPNFSPWNIYERAFRDRRWKLIRRSILPDGFYDLVRDPFEQHNLLQGTLTPEQQRAYDRLQGELTDLLES